MILRILPRGSSLPDAEWQSRHRGIMGLLWAHAVALPLFALVRGFSPAHTILESVILPALALLAAVPALSRRARTVVASAGLLTASAILVHMSGGVIEMHFHFFVMVSVVALYQDWMPFGAAIAYVFVHHGAFGALNPESVFNHQAALSRPWLWAGIHALFIAGISATCLVTWRLNETTLGLRQRAEDRLHEEVAVVNTLLEASQLLATSLELEPILHGLARLLASRVADYCVIDLRDPSGVPRRFAAGNTSERQSLAIALEAAPPDLAAADHPVARAFGPGQHIHLLDPAPPDLFGSGVEWPAADLPRSALVVPVIGRHEVLAVLTLARSRGRDPLDEGDMRVAEEMARRAAFAVENARLFDRQRSVSETLQHSLLPDHLVEIPGLEVAARYRAGGPGVEVGGDWYDLLSLANGKAMVAMGDVVGRGERAAALMGQLRTAARVYALEGRSPGSVIGRLNDLLHELGPGDMATMVCAELDPEAGALVLASAGHPPPIAIGPDGRAVLVECSNGPPLGAVARARYDQVTLPFEAGSTLVLFTDGLVEDRSTPIDVGLDRLSRAVAGGPTSLDDLCARALATIDDGCCDDVALLALRMATLGPHLELRIPTRPATLQPLRTTLRRWLAGSGADDQETYEVVVAAVEACANAIRHTRWSGSGCYEVEGSLGEEVVLTVRDEGTWRPERPGDDGGGRGLNIINAFMDHVEIVTDDTGTTVTMRRRLRAGDIAQEVDA
ncbi:MAG TPA: GAF domain-containing SpoIIE family protein phosphatase [Acidimicrobiales bacterium]|nr:GAF domain-containing SpoIIE family protein phosphatase [Acidimicrobiales bacterium]